MSKIEVVHTVRTVRDALVAQIGDCCQGGDPFCTGGCLVEMAMRKNFAVSMDVVAPTKVSTSGDRESFSKWWMSMETDDRKATLREDIFNIAATAFKAGHDLAAGSQS